MGAILSFFFPWEDTGPDTRDTKEEQGGVKEVDKAEVKETAEVQETKVTVPKITEEAMEEADYEVVEKNDDISLMYIIYQAMMMVGTVIGKYLILTQCNHLENRSWQHHPHAGWSFFSCAWTYK